MEKQVTTENRTSFKNANESYKEKYQFLLTVNDNVICQRYFKVNDYIPGSMNTLEFMEAMRYITSMIKNELVRKSRIYEWCTANLPLKMTGFRQGEEETFFEVPEQKDNKFDDSEELKPYDVTFTFSFMVDEKPVYEEIWDGTQYPKYVRNSVDLSNYTPKFDDITNLNFKQSLKYRMTVGEPDTIYNMIKVIYSTISGKKDGKKFTKNVNFGKDKDGNEVSYNFDRIGRKSVEEWREYVHVQTNDYWKECANFFDPPVRTKR